jgi:hypothetical protein
MLIETLEEARNAIPSAEQLALVQREEIADIIEETIAELKKETPNNTKIRSMLGAIGDSFKLIIGALDIYDRLKGLFIPLGIYLP